MSHQELTKEPLLSQNDISRINKALKSSDMVAICRAIGEAIRLHNISEIARKAGLTRTSVYRAFAGGKTLPNFSTVVSLLDAIGLQLKVTHRPRQVKRRDA